MKKISLIILSVAVSMFFAACEPPASKTGTNNATANANAAKPAASAPAADTLLALDKQANEAFFKGDGKYFDGFLSDKFVSYDSGNRRAKTDLVKMIDGNKCDVKTWSLDDPKMAKIDDDNYVLSYKGTFDGSCTGADGKSMKIPSPVRAATVWTRNGEKWQASFHGETLIIDPKNPPAAPAAETKEEPKKEEAKKEDDKPAANTAESPAKPASDANTDALVKIHTSGWEAFKAKDAKKFDEIVSSNMSIVDPLGNWISGKADVIKQWTETMKCEGITKVSVTDGFASALSPTVELLTLKGTADGTCDGQKNGPLYQSAVYVKEGDAWKLVFMFESPAM
jgi:ketosteroid isomerase-like protein